MEVEHNNFSMLQDFVMDLGACEDNVSGIIDALQPFLLPCKIFGLRSFAMAAESDKWKRNWCHLAHSFTLISLNLISLVFNILFNIHFFSNENITFLILIQTSTITLSSLLLLILVQDSFMNFGKYRELMKLISFLDELQYDGPDKVVLKMKKIVRIEIIVCSVGIVVSMAFYLSRCQNKLVFFLGLFAGYQGCLLLAFNLQYVNLVLIVRYHLRRLNSCIDKDAATIRAWRRTYDVLCDVVDLVLSLLEPCVVFILLLILLGVMSIVYIMVSGAASHFFGDVGAGQFTVGILFNFADLLVLTVPAHLVSREANATLILVTKLLVETPPQSQLHEELQLFAQQLMLRRIEFRIYGVLSVDLRLIAGFVTTLTTYTVVLFSFK